MSDTRAIETDAALRALRDDTDFHSGALALLTYPTAPSIGYIGHDEFKAMTGALIVPGPGVTVTRGDAGDFEVGRTSSSKRLDSDG